MEHRLEHRLKPSHSPSLTFQEDERITTEAAKRSHDTLFVDQGSMKDRAMASDNRARVATEKLAALQVLRHVERPGRDQVSSGFDTVA
jgi:hypothetical protein